MPPGRNANTGRFTAGGGSGGGGGGFDLGTAYGRIIISTDQIDSAISSAQDSISNGLSRIGDSFRSLENGFNQIGGALTGLTAPLAVAGGVGLKAAADFDSLMKQIEIFGNVSGDQLEQVRQYAIKLGADTKFSTEQAAQAYLELLKSGQTLEQATATLPTVLDLAAAGELDLGRAAGIVSSGLAIYKLKAEDAARVSDALAKAANASRAEVSDLGDALTTAGPVASQYGLSIEDTAAALGVLANNGIMGLEAGTQLKSMLLNLHRPTDDVKGALEQLGVNLYDAQGNARNFNDIIKELDTALDKLPVEKQNELMQTLGGSYGITAMNALRAAGGIGDMMEQMDKAPAAKTLAEAFMNTFKGLIESLQGSIESLWIQTLTPFMNDVLAPLVKQIIAVVNSFTEWAQKNPELTNTIVKVLAALVAVGPILLLLGKGLGLIISLFSGVGTVIGVVLGPVGLLIAGIIALYLAFRDNVGGIRTFLEPIIKQVIGGFQTLFGVLGHFGEIIGKDGIGAAIGYVVNAFAQMLGIVGTDDLWAGAMDIGNGIVNAFMTVVQFIQTYVLPVLTTVANWFLNDALPAVVNFINTAVVPAVQSFIGFLGNLWTIVGPHLQNLANWFIQDALPAILQFISGTVIPMIGQFIQTLTNVWNAVAPYLLALVDWFLNTGLPIIGGIINDFINNFWNPAITTLGQLWTIIQPVLQSLLDWFITEGLPFINDAITGFKDNFLDPVISVLSGIWTTVSTGLTDMYNWFVTTGLPFINQAIDYLKVTYLDPLINTLKTIWDTIKPGLDAVVGFFRDQFQLIGQNFVQPVLDFIAKIPDAVQNAIDELVKLVDAVINNPILQSVNPALAAGSQVWNQTKAGLMSRDSGGPGIAGMQYLIGSPQMNQEVYVPNTNGQFIPNFMDMMEGFAAQGNSQTFGPGSVIIHANSYEEGQAAADGFEERTMELLQARGN